MKADFDDDYEFNGFVSFLYKRMSNLVALNGNDSFNATLERNDVSIIGFGPTPIYQVPPI